MTQVYAMCQWQKRKLLTLLVSDLALGMLRTLNVHSTLTIDNTFKSIEKK